MVSRRTSVYLSVRQSSVRPLTFSNDFISETTEPILLKFHIRRGCVGGGKMEGGGGDERLLKWSRSVDQNGRHAHI